MARKVVLVGEGVERAVAKVQIERVDFMLAVPAAARGPDGAQGDRAAAAAAAEAVVAAEAAADLNLDGGAVIVAERADEVLGEDDVTVKRLAAVALQQRAAARVAVCDHLLAGLRVPPAGRGLILGHFIGTVPYNCTGQS